ncbi:hypothetical protein Vafri_7212, partial [Volvox africanus]
GASTAEEPLPGPALTTLPLASTPFTAASEATCGAAPSMLSPAETSWSISPPVDVAVCLDTTPAPSPAPDSSDMPSPGPTLPGRGGCGEGPRDHLSSPPICPP